MTVGDDTFQACGWQCQETTNTIAAVDRFDGVLYCLEQNPWFQVRSVQSDRIRDAVDF